LLEANNKLLNYIEARNYCWYWSSFDPLHCIFYRSHNCGWPVL